MPTRHVTGEQYIYIVKNIHVNPAQMDSYGVDVIGYQDDSAATRVQLLMSMSFDS